jgi:DNA-binding response OmpR family regulator
MSNIRKLLLVDDDVDLRTLLAEQLALHEEFAIVQAGTVGEALNAIKGDHIDLVLMDVGLPDMDGREGVRVMRKQGLKSPVIMLTANDTEADTVLGLEAGANDYVAKPFRFAVLLARVRAHLRQYEASEDAQFNVGPYVFRPGAKLLLTQKGQKIRLTEKETSILRFLYRAGQRVVAREVLLQEVWGYNAAVTTHTLETHVYRLRQKIEADPGQAKILVTETGGYKLDQEIARLQENPLLALFDEEALRLIAFSSETRLLRGGDLLFREGDRSDGGYYVVSGSLHLAGAGLEETHGPGTLVGETALFAETERPATATAQGPVTVRRIPRHLMGRILEEYPDTAGRLPAHLAAKVADAGHRLRRIDAMLPDEG